MLFHFICYGLDAWFCDSDNWYGLNFETIDNIVYLSILLIIWGYSEDWGFIAKRCLVPIMLLSFLNIIDSVTDLNNYYFFYFTILILNLIYTLIYFVKWKKS
jgi:hypothetical protein